jgi:hypothetical protein
MPSRNFETSSRFKSLLRSLAVWFGVIVILSISSTSAFASEKSTPAGSKQWPEILVQLRENFCDKVQLKV